MKVLISCYACSPYQGSEPGMGWNFVSAIAEHHEVHVVVESKFQQDIARYFSEHPAEKPFIHFYFIGKRRHRLLRKIWPPSYYWFYKKWQKKVYDFACKLEEKEHFDVVHQLNMIGYREPGYLWQMNKPLVWGPIGGFQMTPWRFLPSLGVKGCMYYWIRNVMNLWQMNHLRRVMIMSKRADVIISATQDSYEVITKQWKRDSIIIPEVGLTEIPSAQSETKDDGKLHLCWSGLHIPRKALNLLIEAIAKSKLKNKIVLHVIGEGEYTHRWKTLAERQHLKSIVWHGWVSRQEALQIMKRADVFVITSMADATSTVLLEALSLGLPVIAPNLFGFKNVITPDCGIKIDVHSKSQVVSDLASAIDYLCENEKERLSLSKGAFKRAQDFTWEKKAEAINAIYEKVVN